MNQQVSIPLDPSKAKEIQNDPNKQSELAYCAVSFRYFLQYWKFVDQETGEQRTLGDVIWGGQEQIIEAMENVPKFYTLKARKLGATTLEVAFDGWMIRFGPANCRVHLFSRREDAAKELLHQVHYGLERLPDYMQLPSKKTAFQVMYSAGEDDTRILKSYPASEETAVEASCVHGHVDEWARMKHPEAVWQAIEPTMAGSCHILTTGRGPRNFTSQFWRRCEAGDTEFVPIFVSALNRPDRDHHWLETAKKGMTEQAFKQEYPLQPEDAMFSGGAIKFNQRDLDAAGNGKGPAPPTLKHKYIKAWDIGRHKDAAVGTVIDTSVEPQQVVEYIRLRGVPYPSTQKTIERLHKKYPGITVIEQNNAGEAVAENCNIPTELFYTGQKTKATILEELQLALESRSLQWSAVHHPQLDSEMRNYQEPDTDIVQDSVISLAIANAFTNGERGRSGKTASIGEIGHW